MAQYNGYRSVPHSTYQEWRNATLGNGYNVDGWYGNQCWDFCALLWYQYNLRLITKPAGNGGAADCWLVSKDANAKRPFIKITRKQDIKKGDVIVWNRGVYGSTTGHIAFADEDYHGNSIRTLAQVPSRQPLYENSPVYTPTWTLDYFLGAFRNTMWTDTPEPPTPPTPPYIPPAGNTDYKRDRFPWAIAVNHWDY